MNAVLAPDKKMQKLDGSKRLGPCTHPQHVKISSEIEVLGPRNGCVWPDLVKNPPQTQPQ
jgi:hypothetical protein